MGTGRSKTLAAVTAFITLTTTLPVFAGFATVGRASAPLDGVSTEADMVDVAGIGPTSPIWAEQVRALLEAAAADGVTLTGNSYRDRASQVLLRRAHCGSGYYAVYVMPAAQCSPPTARPGTSMHERGLAIDFHDCATHTTVCFRWLTDNAHRFGLTNLPSEPWHWSPDGT